MKSLVTGGGGFIGSHLCSRLLEANHRVTVLDNFRTGSPANVPSEASLFEADIRHPDFHENLPDENYEVLFHLAGQSSGEVSFDDPAYDLETNARGTLNLLQWAAENNLKRFLYASSMGVYGTVPDKPISEQRVPRPKSFYGVSKLAGENYVKIFNDRGLNTTSFRMFNVYGPGQNLENMKQGMVSIYLSFLLNEEKLTVKGSGERFRDFIFIDDVVDAWLSAVDQPETYGKTFNLASGTRTTVNELIGKMKDILGKPEFPTIFTSGTPGDQFGIYADIEKTKTDLDWEPRTNLESGLAQMIEAEKSHPG